MSISTHVLNAVTGRAAAGVAVSLAVQEGQTWVPIAALVTDADGRIPELCADPVAGAYRLSFDTGSYLAGATFYPEVIITVQVTEPAEHYHVPLLLSPYAYSTYRGT